MNDDQVEFVLKTDKKCIKTRVKQMVDSRINWLDQNLAQRRIKLHNSLSEESDFLEQELVHYNAEMEKRKEITKRIEALQIQSREETRRKEIVAEKEALRLRDNSEDEKFKEFVSQRYDVAMMQKHQILEKKRIAQMEKELDNIWEQISKELHDITELEEKRKKTEEIISKKVYNEKLSEQIKEKMNMAKEELYERIMDRYELEQDAEQYKNDIIRENEEKLRTREQLAKAKYENYKQSITLKNNRQKEETQMNKYYQRLIQYDPAEERRRLIKEKEQARVELELFRDNVLKVRRKQREEEKLEDELRAREASEMEQKEIEMKKIKEIENAKREKDVMKMRMEQILSKQEMRAQKFGYY